MSVLLTALSAGISKLVITSLVDLHALVGQQLPSGMVAILNHRVKNKISLRN